MSMAIIRINRFIVVCDIYSLTLCNSTKIVYFSKSHDRLRSLFFCAALCPVHQIGIFVYETLKISRPVHQIGIFVYGRH